MSAFTDAARHRVAVLVRPGVMPMELGLVHQLFTRARTEAGQRLYEVVTCAVAPGEVTTDVDFPITVAHGPEALAQADTVIVPAAHPGDEEVAAAGLPAGLRAALAQIRTGTRIASICTGAFVLAAAGLLDGKRATTHWQAAEQFRRSYPGIALDPSVLHVDEGAVLTSAGEAAGIDLCLHVIRRDHGQAIANEVARATVVPPHREGGQAQYVHQPLPGCAHSGTQNARKWALEHLDEPISLARLAAAERVSLRTFTRRFHDETGLSPGQWLLQQRIRRARELLEDTDLAIGEITRAAGFGTAAALRQHFRKALGVSPSRYRSTFRGNTTVDT